MSFERPEYEYPIDVIDQHHRADAPAGIYLLAGKWHLAVHDSVAEALLIDQGALHVATLSFDLPARPGAVRAMPLEMFGQLLNASVS